MAAICAFSSISRSRSCPAFSKSCTGTIRHSKHQHSVRWNACSQPCYLEAKQAFLSKYVKVCRRAAASCLPYLQTVSKLPSRCCRAWQAAGHLSAHGGVLLLEQRAQLLVQVARLFRQLRVPQPHARPCLINEVDRLRTSTHKMSVHGLCIPKRPAHFLMDATPHCEACFSLQYTPI